MKKPIFSIEKLYQPIRGVHLHAWMSKAPLFHYSKDRILFYQSHLPYGVYAAFDGAVRFDFGGREESVIIRAPALVGMHQVLEGQGYAATGVVDQEAWIAFFSKDQIQDWIRMSTWWMRPYV